MREKLEKDDNCGEMELSSATSRNRKILDLKMNVKKELNHYNTYERDVQRHVCLHRNKRTFDM